MSEAEDTLATLLRWEQLPEPVREFPFIPGRRFRFDFAWPEQKFALEIEGGSWIQGRHTRGAGFERDLDKYTEAALAGWRVARVTPRQVENGIAILYVRRALDVWPEDCS